MGDNIVWVYIHPTRTGGQTILNTLEREIPPEQILSTSVRRYQKHPEKFDKNKIKFIVGHATYYGIHNLVPNKIPKYFVFLRDPAERMVSYYNAKMLETKEIIPFEGWYKDQMKNDTIHFLDLKYKGYASSRTPVPSIFMPIIRRLNYKSFFFLQTLALKFMKKDKKTELKKLEYAKKLLDKCEFVGIIDNSDVDVPYLFALFGLKNKKWEKTTLSKKILKLDEELREKIYKDNPLDVELYRYALELNKKRKAKAK
jgi:hypothetical protein